MPGCLQEIAETLPLEEYLRKPPQPGIRLFWLGQAGFVLEAHEKRIVIDPYLSDSLAEKYKGTPRPHIRMMPPPVSHVAFIMSIWWHVRMHTRIIWTPALCRHFSSKIQMQFCLAPAR